MFKSALAAVVLMVGVVSLVYAQAQGPAKPAKVDKDFVDKAASGGMFEVQLGTYATTKAQNPDVKKFGQHMVDDHSKANQQLTQIAQQKGITVPQTMDSKDRKNYDRLTKMSGAEFDRAYMSQMIKDHEKDIKEFKHQAQNGKDQDLKTFASNTVPTLESHLRLAEEIAPKVGVKTSARAASSNTGSATK
ncbi:MAG TPA: DUF4142 domain-containing protein [Tepidisphaeraceae bacterium]|nr:DUF4142 domain-containing protein [Tepidisphaeraceae bacterium]